MELYEKPGRSAYRLLRCSVLLDGIVGMLIGVVIGSIIILCILNPLWSKFAKKPTDNNAANSATNTNPGCESRISQLPLQEPALPLLVGTNELGRITRDFRLEDGKLTILQLDQYNRVHRLEPITETLLKLSNVKFTNGVFLRVVVHVMCALPSNAEVSGGEPLTQHKTKAATRHPLN